METRRKPEERQLIWEVQLGKVQQQIICSAGAESCFTEQFCSSVISTLLAMRCVCMGSLPLHAEVDCMCCAQLEKGGCWAACAEGSLSESFIM